MIRVRAAVVEDGEAVARVWAESWRVAYRGHVPEAFLARQVERLAARGAWQRERIAGLPERERLLVAEADAALVGFASFGASRDEDAGERGELYAIYVHPDAWDTRAGRALIEGVRSGLVELGFREATLWVLESNARARRFYERDLWRADGATKVDRREGAELREVRYRRSL